ncbi:ABC transporter permease [Heliophilum fasciatum]|uniref:Transport permease protein n=1 Tax=Heliophilum fasciatum TaxID=35700 RepID=A0A4R2S0T0_9FIRM|nr:ABC transporter permease [Heliophilum fasciatum]MCW2277586.1 lipooligosaccharide transport system permease protein [Heliophilum fasciatum]TCP64935.1 lipooligosaccharide transport system permease protein [Heliophilum fasciatum]
MIEPWRILRRHLTIFSRTFWTNTMFNFFEPFLYLTAMGYGLGAFVQEMEGISYMEYIAPGIVASSAMFAATFECTYGSFVRLHYQKTFHAILAGPVTVRDIIIAEALFGMIKCVVFGAVILLVIAVMGQVRSSLALLIPLFLILPGLFFSLMAVTYTCLAPNIDYFNYYITLFVTPLYLFGGVFFPLTGMPVWAQKLAWFNPLSHSVEVCRALALGQPAWPTIGEHVLWFFIGSALLLAPPIHLMRRRLIQ